MNVDEKLARLRELMKRESISSYIITKSDPHQSEYTPDYWNQVEYISGFTGSAGIVAVTMDHAGLWTDGRYYIQAERELAGSEFILHRDSDTGVRNLEEFVADETAEGGAIGFNGNVLSMSRAAKIEKLIKFKRISLKTDMDLIGEMWDDRPALSKAPVFNHELRFCGVSRTDKLSMLRETMKKKLADFNVISSADDIAWLFNLRGNDMPCKSFFESFAVIDYESAALFIDKDKTRAVREELERDGVTLLDIGDIYKYLEEYNRGRDGSVVLLNPDKTAYALSRILNNCEISECATDITTSMKAIKNGVELANLEKVNIRDGIAMVRFIMWLKENAGKGIDEADAADKVTEFREVGEYFVEPSFTTIAAYMANAAMMHYSPERGACAVIKAEGALLVDSGGNYYDGSTDITRTIVLGRISDQFKHDFTLTLKSHISMAEAVFSYGAAGTSLDMFARIPMWKECMDYKSGTGHGLGFFLNVHEGPQALTPRPNTFVFEEGMIITNEPGVYREGEYGIRTENTMKAVKHTKNEFGQFMKFEVFSYCPIDLDGIDSDMLTSGEKDWLNNYHSTVYEKLSPDLSPEERVWLAAATRAIVS
ncbi:MAG: aminopeptidase P family N-terminal domain-containing protein [Clostridiales bacterium]|jgi:Xaa-Pro aminopeptidase|nr:aminopeptidase P family N-terminal domain-containing protein [Clostridiales bacterium]